MKKIAKPAEQNIKSILQLPKSWTYNISLVASSIIIVTPFVGALIIALLNILSDYLDTHTRVVAYINSSIPLQSSALILLISPILIWFVGVAFIVHFKKYTDSRKPWIMGMLTQLAIFLAICVARNWTDGTLFYTNYLVIIELIIPILFILSYLASKRKNLTQLVNHATWVVPALILVGIVLLGFRLDGEPRFNSNLDKYSGAKLEAAQSGINFVSDLDDKIELVPNLYQVAKIYPANNPDCDGLSNFTDPNSFGYYDVDVTIISAFGERQSFVYDPCRNGG